MKVTYNWIKEFVRFNYTPQQLADHLTMLGLEVELVVPVKLFFSGVTVGKILEIRPHPNSPDPCFGMGTPTHAGQGRGEQKLLLCKVTTGKETHRIICGAHNISVGDLVPTALIGAVLADNTTIAKHNIQGIDSFGMLCSEKELGLSDMANGIFILSSENTNGRIPKIGQPLQKALDLDDTILDINVTPNRSDALSIIGIAREISSLTGNPLKFPKIYFPQKGPLTKELVDVKVKATRLCPRYTARVITDVKIKTSPFWIRYRLGLLGLRPINNIVDITNYVLLELGQPLHAFDYKTISDAKIIIRTAAPGEQIITIDNETRPLDKDVLVIADKKRPIAIAGVMGGEETEVGDKTTDILLESAYFEPTNIRRTSKRYGIVTESSFRFERAIDPELSPIASNRATQLIIKMAGGSVSKGIIDCKKDIPKPPLIKLDISYCRRIIGVDIPRQKINTILKELGCKVYPVRGSVPMDIGMRPTSNGVKKAHRDSIVVKPPSWRQDITKKIDLVEEVARIFGYTNIPPTMPEALVKAPGIQRVDELIKKLYELLTGMGLNEIITYSFINPLDMSTLRASEQKHIRLVNPVDRNMCVMRTTLIPGIINTIVYNSNRGNESVHVFELGRCFSSQGEEPYLGIGILGSPQAPQWQKTAPVPDFFYLKGILEELFRKLFINNFQFPKIETPTFHPGKTCAIKIDNKQIGIFGQLHPQIIRALDIKDKAQEIYVAELNIKSLIESVPEHTKYQSLPRFPSVKRDISIILDKNIEGYDIIKAVKEIGLDTIESINIFDVYEGHPIPEGKKSIAYTITYRHKERTLTDEEVDNIHNIVRQKILENLPNANFRQ